MMRLLCAVLVFASGITAEAADRARVPPQVAELLTLSGVERQLAQLPESVADGFNATAGRFSAETAERIRVILKDAYRRDAIYPVLTSAMTERYDARQARAAVQVLRTPLFRRLQALEDDLVGREGEARIRAFSEQLPDRPPGVERHVLVRRLDSALGATSAQIEVLTSTVAAFGAVSAGAPLVRDVRAGHAGADRGGREESGAAHDAVRVPDRDRRRAARVPGVLGIQRRAMVHHGRQRRTPARHVTGGRDGGS
jgi:hypothetical protein